MVEDNAKMVEYGIKNEKSDIRAHVSVVNKAIYVFQTKKGVKAINDHELVRKPAYQKGVEYPTAIGFLVPIDKIEDLRRIDGPLWPYWSFFSESLSTTEKGELAVKCVIAAMRNGRFPFWVKPSEADDISIQIQGVDILIFMNQKIQVKCDYRGGDKPNGTGNLFLQEFECNPLKLT